MKYLIKDILTIALGLLIGIVGAFLVIEWMVGCGETYIDSKGVTHSNECVFINISKESK